MHVIMHVSMHVIGLSQLAKTNRPCTARAAIELNIENEIMNLNVFSNDLLSMAQSHKHAMKQD